MFETSDGAASHKRSAQPLEGEGFSQGVCHLI